MSFFDSIRSLFGGRRPSLPAAPRPPDSAVRIFLRKDQVNWRTVADLKEALGDRLEVNGKRLNLRGAVLDGSKLPRPKNSQDENAIALTIGIEQFVLHNGWVDNIPGGIVVKAGFCAFEGLKFIRPGEDFLSTVGEDADGISINHCEFWNTAGGDKSIQLNQALRAVVNDTLVVGGITGMRVQKASYKTRGVTVVMRDVTFRGCDTGLNVAGGASVRLYSPVFKDVRKKWVIGDGGGKVIQT
jgi:hypothetical protein